MFQDIKLHDLLKKQKEESIALVDVRSPKEFAEFRIPGSINIPVFDDDERAEVGTIYKQVSPEAAKKKGLEIFSAKLPEFIAQFQTLGKEKVVYCWRGGMRSKTAATVVDLMGEHVSRLDGGIRSYRQWVVKKLDELHSTPKLYVLNGYTGSGKTILLQRLKQKGYPVIDLEGMANHRGSIFGQIGLEPHNQKTFESLLVQELEHYNQSPYLLLEGESKRVGKVSLPLFLHEAKEAGMQLFIHLPLEKRIENILHEYHPEEHQTQIIEAFQRIQKHIHTPVAKQIAEDLEQGNFSSAVELLLDYYYDPRYEHTLEQYPSDRQIHIHADGVDEALEAVINFINQEENIKIKM
ncbi:tRNA 2-selenouridine(34) synthase MnmH [Oceanobacillus sp. J11TS1]|uniref:tRNA 2-selenouridine(34) synthase MnmH n=1 Tax=Oceanobacillus sp. J11TS1 TaxID=2807191 RepID=UPI001B2A5FA7|nr:tRNA 2-selenouridine(34) synthase MnmH [Oceanobacillus sp. J11TS1]GIO24533.1 tRNA 2-selenouridine synthase [Oceanobacillus sp. J11TS1]